MAIPLNRVGGGPEVTQAVLEKELEGSIECLRQVGSLDEHCRNTVKGKLGQDHLQTNVCIAGLGTCITVAASIKKMRILAARLRHTQLNAGTGGRRVSFWKFLGMYNPGISSCIIEKRPLGGSQ